MVFKADCREYGDQRWILTIRSSATAVAAGNFGAGTKAAIMMMAMKGVGDGLSSRRQATGSRRAIAVNDEA